MSQDKIAELKAAEAKAAKEKLEADQAAKVAAELKAKQEAEAKAAKEAEGDFDVEAYTTTVNLTFDAMLRKGGKLPEKEAKQLKEAEAKAYKNKGCVAAVTDTYRVGTKTVKLIKGLATPEELFNLFSESGQKALFV